ncbi:cell division protein FtsK [Amycolatopsis acidiphila]|uniref:Cell division protein FtsK n=1 Tax=Amycolatopsis acidiphila TaxID=715473 RepID=A0A558AEH2_9PSEU|nr:FtsK/SpoIIIE domain-containing protein [Amycolatopsis acidiphila]TVT22670.1 cell division protein FtsK [Amycolatopsis acidiphila]UIJ59566.1 cell division protein FtsK [Amycolatopsis acidiphila]GHG80667.1 cell division protein FtsK [Amycolatopsis acidiphila]
MGAHTFGVLLLGTAGLAVVVWVLHKLGRALAAIAETLAAAAVVFLALWWLLKGIGWMVKEIVTHPRTALTVVAVAAWLHWWGWLSLVVSIAAVAAALGLWRLVDLVSFDQWAGQVLRSWWFRWAVYMPKLPGWLHACGLSVKDESVPVDVTVNLVGRKKISRDRQQPGVRIPKVKRVKSGPSWDEVRVQLVPGQKPEDFDEAARALASARKVARCQVREVAPNVVSVDFQRRDLLAAPVPCRELEAAEIDLRRVWAGRTEYGQDRQVPLFGSGSHTLTAGASGAGKNSVMWSPLVSIASAVRDRLVRVSGIDPKGMELAYGRGIFHRYAVTPEETVDLLDELIASMNARKEEFAGHVRTVPVTRENPLELVEFDEIGALTRYTDRKTRDLITERGCTTVKRNPRDLQKRLRLKSGRSPVRPRPWPRPKKPLRCTSGRFFRVRVWRGPGWC